MCVRVVLHSYCALRAFSAVRPSKKGLKRKTAPLKTNILNDHIQTKHCSYNKETSKNRPSSPPCSLVVVEVVLDDTLGQRPCALMLLLGGLAHHLCRSPPRAERQRVYRRWRNTS